MRAHTHAHAHAHAHTHTRTHAHTHSLTHDGIHLLACSNWVRFFYVATRQFVSLFHISMYRLVAMLPCLKMTRVFPCHGWSPSYNQRHRPCNDQHAVTRGFSTPTVFTCWYPISIAVRSPVAMWTKASLPPRQPSSSLGHALRSYNWNDPFDA